MGWLEDAMRQEVSPYGFSPNYTGKIPTVGGQISPVQQPTFTPVSQGIQQMSPQQPRAPQTPFQMSGPPQGFPTQPRPMPPMAQGQGMPNLATMLAQLGGKFPLMDPSQFGRNTAPTRTVGGDANTLIPPMPGETPRTPSPRPAVTAPAAPNTATRWR